MVQALEWVVRDVQKLRDYVETLDSTNEDSSQSSDDFEVLRESPMLGDGKFRLGIGNCCSVYFG